VTAPTTEEIDAIRRLARSAGGYDELLIWVRLICGRPRGRPTGASRYAARDRAVLEAIEAAAGGDPAALARLIPVNVALMGRSGASPQADVTRLRRKSRQYLARDPHTGRR
jgi:hypothetical protein